MSKITIGRVIDKLKEVNTGFSYIGDMISENRLKTISVEPIYRFSSYMYNVSPYIMYTAGYTWYSFTLDRYERHGAPGAVGEKYVLPIYRCIMEPSNHIEFFLYLTKEAKKLFICGYIGSGSYGGQKCGFFLQDSSSDYRYYAYIYSASDTVRRLRIDLYKGQSFEASLADKQIYTTAMYYGFYANLETGELVIYNEDGSSELSATDTTIKSTDRFGVWIKNDNSSYRETAYFALQYITWE